MRQDSRGRVIQCRRISAANHALCITEWRASTSKKKSSHVRNGSHNEANVRATAGFFKQTGKFKFPISFTSCVHTIMTRDAWKSTNINFISFMLIDDAFQKKVLVMRAVSAFLQQSPKSLLFNSLLSRGQTAGF